MSIAVRTILILDYGSQYTQLIARAVRDSQVYCEIHPHDLTADKIKAIAPAGIILSGGPESVFDDGAPRVNSAVFDQGAPVLGICYGMQAMAAHFGGEVAAGGRREYGAAKVRQIAPCPLLDGVWSGANTVWMSHGTQVTRMPDNFSVVAESESGVVAAVADSRRRLFGLQFHPEVAHTGGGREILRGFLHGICRLQKEWTTPCHIERITNRVREQVGGEGVLLALSGGVDSAVAAALLHRAVGPQLHCVLVDNGLLRKNEAQNIVDTFASHFAMPLRVVDAGDKFFDALSGISSPEEKRRRIGELFARIFESEAKNYSRAKWLAQGTIYPDVVESAMTGAGKSKIKTHHNVGGLPQRLNLKLLEPLRELFKDEVRRLGTALGLPQKMVYRHPFPGPGLAVRVLGEVTEARAAVVREADAIFMELLESRGLYNSTAQAFSVLLPVQTVGVMGDGRTYENVLALRAVTTEDFMTADWARLPFDFLAEASSRIINRVPGVNRVVYDISTKPPATVEWE